MASKERLETAKLLGQITSTLQEIGSNISEIKDRLDEGNQKFAESSKEIQGIKLECATRGVNCPAIHNQTPKELAQSIPLKYVGIAIVFAAAGFYGLVVIIAKFLKIDLPSTF